MFPKTFTQFFMLLAVASLFTGCAADDPLTINEPEVQTYLPPVELAPIEEEPTAVLEPNYDASYHMDFTVLEPMTTILLDEYVWGRGENVDELQVLLGVTVDGQYGSQTRMAHIELLEGMGWSTEHVPGAPAGRSGSSSNANPTPQCTEWWDVARSAGWAEEDLPKLGRIMFKESTCRPGAISPTRDYGLTQINWAAHGGRLTSIGLTREDLLDPYTNLVQAKYIADSAASWAGCKWQPWYMSGDWC
jgi:hypothetical protein